MFLANYERKGIRITPKSIIMDKNIINNSNKTLCKMDVSDGPAHTWLKGLPANSVWSWAELKARFIQKFKDT